MSQSEHIDSILHEKRGPDPPLEATGIMVSIRDIDHRERFGGGWPSWVIPLGGGEVSCGGVTVEVCPAVEMRTDQWRDYGEINRLATQVDQNGGFMWTGDRIHVGQEVLVGRDALDLLTALWKRADERMSGGEQAAYCQGYNDALRDVQKRVGEIVDSMHHEVPK